MLDELERERKSLTPILERTSFACDDMMIEGQLKELINYMYSDLQTRWNDCQYLLERAILTTINKKVDEINE